MASTTQITRFRRNRKRTTRGKNRKRRVRKQGTTPPRLPTK